MRAYPQRTSNCRPTRRRVIDVFLEFDAGLLPWVHGRSVRCASQRSFVEDEECGPGRVMADSAVCLHRGSARGECRRVPRADRRHGVKRCALPSETSRSGPSSTRHPVGHDDGSCDSGTKGPPARVVMSVPGRIRDCVVSRQCAVVNIRGIQGADRLEPTSGLERTGQACVYANVTGPVKRSRHLPRVDNAHHGQGAVMSEADEPEVLWEPVKVERLPMPPDAEPRFRPDPTTTPEVPTGIQARRTSIGHTRWGRSLHGSAILRRRRIFVHR
jgi:hypothetical protein